MKKLTRQDLFGLEKYAERRPEIRAEVMAHKKPRHIALGEHVRVLFEDRVTIQYQIQEMLRAERIFEAAGIQEELDAYNPLIPDGDNLKATLLLEYEDVEQRRVALEQLKGIEDRVYVRIGEKIIFAIADEDIERENDTKTASVHFLRFQFDKALIERLRKGAEFVVGVDHPQYIAEVVLNDLQRWALLADFE
ncbi:MAG TPA: DUF3501 family protein [Spongiibacteraceae bacterium]|nr:DUF3501 family protein [Spongiibacteraceae bacterium]